MRIEELHLKNFRCFKELDITFPKSNLAVFIGLNGSGKSAILDAIALLLESNQKELTFNPNLKSKYKYKYKAEDILTDSTKIENEISIKDDWAEIVSWKNIYENNRTKKIDKKEELPIIPTYEKFNCTYYKAYNKEIYAINNSNSGVENTDFDSFDNWFKETEDFENELKIFNEDFKFSDAKLDVVRKSMSTFFSNLSGKKFSNLKAKRVFIDNRKKQTYKNEAKKYESFLVIQSDGKEFKLSQLSEGERLLIHIVGDIAYRLTMIYWQDFPDTKQKDDSYIKNVMESNGIVLIDEIELHLHPQWQREVLPALQKTFPNIQFIVTTHSPQVLSNLKKEEVFILKDNKISEFKPYVEGRDSNSILSEIFGVSERPKIFQDKLNEVYKAIDNQELEEARKLLKNLEEYWGASDTEILKADLNLSFAEE